MSHRYGMVVGLAIVALAATAPTASAETDQQLRDDVMAREQRSDLIGAHAVQRRIQQPDKADRAHTLSLMATLQALNTADSLRDNGDAAAAAALLDAQRAKLDPVEDRFLIVAVSRASKQAANAARADADAEAIGALSKADTLARRDEWARAATVYKSVATQPAGTIDSGLRRRGVVGQLAAEREAAERAPGPVMSLVNGTLRGSVRWGVIAAMLLAVWLLVRCAGWGMRRFPKGRVTVALREVIEQERRAAHQDEALSQELVDAIVDAQQPTLSAGLVDVRDLDGTAITPLPRDAFTVGSEPSAIDASVSIGGVGVNLGQLLQSVRRTLARPAETQLTGTVRTDGDTAFVSLQGCFRGKPLGSWNASGPRDEAIRAVARQYVIQSGQARATASWPSHRAYCEALEQLGAKDPKAGLVAARRALERALAYDRFNLPARLRLGGVLRLLGDNLESARQFEVLLADVSARRQLPPLARALVDAHREIPYLARYQRGIALAKLKDHQAQAREELGTLVQDLDARDDIPALRTLRPLALAAWGAAHLGLGNDARSCAWVLKQLDKIGTRLDDSGGARSEARAVLENARARVLFRLGRFDDARRAADQALDITPELSDARITLASIYMKTRDEHGDWVGQTERQLERAYEASPDDPRLLYRLGRFYDVTGNHELAHHYYERVPHDWKALERRAHLLCRDGDPEAALKLRVRANHIRPATGTRLDALIQTFLHAARAADDDIDAVLGRVCAGDPRIAEIKAHADVLRDRGAAVPRPAAVAMAP